VLRVHVRCLASLAEVDVSADRALVPDPDDRESLAAVADDTLMHNVLLQLNSCLGSRDEKFIDLLLEVPLDF
jgi:hypothetical protein